MIPIRLVLLASLAVGLCPAMAFADAASDLRSDPSLRLWLDSLDTEAADVDGSVGNVHPAYDQIVATWKDKSTYHHDATGSAGAWNVNLGIRFSGGSPGYVLPTSVYGSTPSNTMEMFIFVRPEDPLPTFTWNYPVLYMSDGNKGLVTAYAGNQVTGQTVTSIRHQSDYVAQGTTTGFLTTSYQSGGASVSQPYFGSLINYQVNGPASRLVLRQDGKTPITTTTTIPQFSNSASGVVRLGGQNVISAGYMGLVGTVMIFSRVLNTVERALLTEYISLWNRYDGVNQAEVYSPTGLFDRTLNVNTNFPYKFYRDYLGGIGQDVDGIVTKGTSAGLTITNVNFLANPGYLLAATETGTAPNKVPYTGTRTAAQAFTTLGGLLPSGYTAGSYRRWYIDRTNGSLGAVKLRFDLNNMGVTPQVGQTLGLLTRNGSVGSFSAVTTQVYDGSGAVEFTINNPQDGIYMVGIGPDLPPAPNISASLTSVSQSDGFSSSNFFNLPGSILRQTATVSNKGNASPTAGTVSADFPIPANAKLRLADLGAVGSGPVLFKQGTPTSGLSYTFSSLSSTTDSLSFSRDNGTTFTYTPVVNASDQTDANITHFRVTLPGTFATSAAAPYPSFTVSYDLKIK